MTMNKWDYTDELTTKLRDGIKFTNNPMRKAWHNKLRFKSWLRLKIWKMPTSSWLKYTNRCASQVYTPQVTWTPWNLQIDNTDSSYTTNGKCTLPQYCSIDFSATWTSPTTYGCR